MSQPSACRHCGHVGEPSTATPGHFGVEVVLWLLLIIPGLVYSIWRISSRREVCAMCGSADIIPAESPIGRQLAQGQPAAAGVRKPRAGAVNAGRALGQAVRGLIKRR